MRTTEPTMITAGERVEWIKSYSDYPADEWTLQYRFRGPSPGFNIDATADGDDFINVIPAATSATLSSGRYRWQSWVTEIADATNTIEVGGGLVTVKLGFAEDTLDAVDIRTDAKKALDAIDAALSNAATADQLEYEISTPAGSRRVKRMSRNELLTMRKHYAGIVAGEIAAERSRCTGKFGRTVLINVRER